MYDLIWFWKLTYSTVAVSESGHGPVVTSSRSPYPCWTKKNAHDWRTYQSLYQSLYQWLSIQLLQAQPQHATAIKSTTVSTASNGTPGCARMGALESKICCKAARDDLHSTTTPWCLGTREALRSWSRETDGSCWFHRKSSHVPCWMDWRPNTKATKHNVIMCFCPVMAFRNMGLHWPTSLILTWT